MKPAQPDEPARGGDAPPEANGHAAWFYVQRGEMYGPVSSADLCAAAHLGFLGPDDMVRRSDKTFWVAARAVHGLYKTHD